MPTQAADYSGPLFDGHLDELMKGYRAWPGATPAGVARGIAWDNAAGLYGAAAR